MPHRLNLQIKTGRKWEIKTGNTAIKTYLEKGSIITFFPFTCGYIIFITAFNLDVDFEGGIFLMPRVPTMYLVNQVILQKPFF